MTKGPVTIYDVAREAGVSMATVSRVVNGNPNVKPSTRKKVAKVIKRLNYYPNAVARGLASKKTTTVGVIIPDVTNLYFSSLARGIDDVASMYEYNIILANSDGEEDKEVHVFNTTLAQQVDGIIFMGHRLSDVMQERIETSYVPVVLAGTVDENNELPSVSVDFLSVTNQTTDLLINNGNKKIALIGLAMNSSKQKNSTEGYKNALAKANIPFDDSLIIRVDSDVNSMEVNKLVDKLLKLNVDSAVVEDDRIAIILLNELSRRGIDLPGEFELVTSNNSPLVDLSYPKMTTVSQPLYDIGAVAMRMLTKLMGNEEIENKQVLLPYGITENQTTKEN